MDLSIRIYLIPKINKILNELSKFKDHYTSGEVTQKEIGNISSQIENTGILKELQEIKAPLSPKEFKESEILTPQSLMITNSELNNARIDSEKDQKPIIDEEELEKFFITNANNDFSKFDETILKKSKLFDDTILKGITSLSIFDSQILNKEKDQKKLKQQLDLMASDTLFYDSISILDEVDNSLDLMKALKSEKIGQKELSKTSVKSFKSQITLVESLIQELIDRRLLIEDYIPASKLVSLAKSNKLYRGITIHPRTFEAVDTMWKDDFSACPAIAQLKFGQKGKQKPLNPSEAGINLS
jgi:hypothetical protein